MGCALSKQDEEDDVVALCRERKRLLKLAVERRYAFADAQCKYNQSLYAVAMALRLFVARHSSPSSPFLITYPSTSTNVDSNETLITSEMFHQQRPTEAIYETIASQTSDSKVSLASSKLKTQNRETQEDNSGVDDEEEFEEEEESESEDGVRVCEHFYGEMGLSSMPSLQIEDFGWDFFNPFDEVKAEEVNGFSQSFDEDLRAVREKEGIPELEEYVGRLVMNENEVVNVHNDNVFHKESGVADMRSGDDDANVGVGIGDSKGWRVIDNPTDGRELLEALKDIEDHFLRAYECGLEISRMLGANRVQLQSGLEEIKESSNKLVRSVTWNRSYLSRSSSCKSLLTSSSISSSTWTDSKNDPLDDDGMEAGSHSLTLGRLYAWEKKLYEEVKTGDQTSKIYERKFSHFRNHDAIGDGICTMDKSRAEVDHLHTRISVAIRSVESISDRIEKLRDEELQPQLLELLHSLMRNWTIMLESHETQNRVMLEVKSFNCPAYGKFCNDSHRLATLQLEAELNNWCSCFAVYVSAQKAYTEALSGWLFKFIAPEVEFYSGGKAPVLPCGINGPPLLVTCQNWLACLEKLPDKAVTCALKSFEKDIHAIWCQQGEEQQQKRKVDGLAKELDNRALALQRAERRIIELKISQQESEVSVRNRIEFLAERKNLLDMFKKRLDAEKGKHLTSMQETQQIIINGFQTGFSSVFESLAEFSKASVKMYTDLLTYSANAKSTNKNDFNPSCMEGMGSQVRS